MKWHITSWLFTKLDDFLPFVIYMVKWSLHNKKLRFLLIHNSWKTDIIFFQSLNHVDFYLKPWFLIKSGYYIVPSPSIALLSTCLFSMDLHLSRELQAFAGSYFCMTVYRKAGAILYHWNKLHYISESNEDWEKYSTQRW